MGTARRGKNSDSLVGDAHPTNKDVSMLARRCLLVALALALTTSTLACCGMFNPASRLYGKWKLDFEESLKRSVGDNQLQAAAARLAWGFYGGNITIDFRSDGTASFNLDSLVGGGSNDGKWSVTSAEGDTLKVQVTPDDSEKPSTFTIHLIDADTFELEDLGQVNVAVFRREKK